MCQTDVSVVGRLINHSSDPNCTAKMILIGGQKKMVIYAKVDTQADDEVTYDYDFPIENERVCTNRFPSYHIPTASIRLRVFAAEPNVEDSSINALIYLPDISISFNLDDTGVNHEFLLFPCLHVFHACRCMLKSSSKYLHAILKAEDPFNEAKQT
jgi:hypothetical protein